MQDVDRSEVRLLYRIVAKDQTALEELYTLYYPRLSRFFLRVLGVAEQQALPGLINEVMYVVWNKANTFNHTSKVSSWIFGIALRIGKKHKSTQIQYESKQSGREHEAAELPVETWESRLESSDLLRKAMVQLSQDQKTVIELTYFNGLHYSEIADIMNCPENTVKTRMYHARLRLRSILRELEKNPAAE